MDELRELQRLTGDEQGAQRVCWTPTWLKARDWLGAKLAELPGVEQEIDEAGNQWATLPGRSPAALVIGGHLDSVPNGGWLDGCLNVVAGLELGLGMPLDLVPLSHPKLSFLAEYVDRDVNVGLRARCEPVIASQRVARMRAR